MSELQLWQEKKKIKQQLLSILIIGLFLLSGCFPKDTHFSNITSETARASTITPLPKPTITINRTLVETTKKTLEPTVSYPEKANFTFTCFDIQSMSPDSAMNDGYLILDGDFPLMESDPRTNVTIMKNMLNHNITRLSQAEENFIHIIGSPNRGWIAYDQYIYGDPLVENLVISDALEEKKIVIPWENNWLNLVSWLGNDQILIRLFSDDEDNSNATKYLVLNPFTGIRRVLDLELSTPYSQHSVNRVEWDGWGITTYNLSLDRAISLQGSDISSTSYILWDISNQESVTELEVPVGRPNKIPRWSPDGDRFALSINSLDFIDESSRWPVFELYVFDKNGKIEQHTNLNSYFTWISISDYSWSVEADSIAFWFSAGIDQFSISEYYPEYLGIFNLYTNQVTLYCVPGDYSVQVDNRSNFVPPPLWSPDGNQLVVVNRYDSENHNRVILVDLETGQAYQIAENAIPAGWLAKNKVAIP